MAMEIVRTASHTQNQALSTLLNALKSGQPLQGRVQSVTVRPSGDAQVRINIAGQGLDVKVDAGNGVAIEGGGAGGPPDDANAPRASIDTDPDTGKWRGAGRAGRAAEEHTAGWGERREQCGAGCLD